MHTHIKSNLVCSIKHEKTTKSIMAVRILPCLGTSSCPVVAGSRLNWCFSPLVPLLLCQADSVTVTSHPPLPIGNRLSWRPLPVSHFLSPLVSLSLSLSTRLSSSSSGSPVKNEAQALRPQHQQLLLFRPSIHLPFDRSNQMSASPQAPLLPSKLYCMKQGQELHSHVTQVDWKKKSQGKVCCWIMQKKIKAHRAFGKFY